jgi:GR25 family glycosyltransferase involved in LPS biosynthesis
MRAIGTSVHKGETRSRSLVWYFVQLSLSSRRRACEHDLGNLGVASLVTLSSQRVLDYRSGPQMPRRSPITATQTAFPQTGSSKSEILQAIIITNHPETLRSSVLHEAHFNGKWLDSSLCQGIPRANTREALEGEIFLAGLLKPPTHVYDAMSLSEVGCTYAHLKALSMAASRDRPTLILEDDAEFDPENLQRILTNLDKLPEDTVIKLEGDDKPGKRIVLGPHSTELNFMVSIRPSRGSAGYLVTPVSAARLIQAAHNYPLQYDVLLNDSHWHGCFLLDAVPFPIRQAGQTSSTIDRGIRKRGIGNRLARQFEKLKGRVRRISAQLHRAHHAKFTCVRFAKFYEKE